MHSRKKKDITGIDSGDEYSDEINDKLNDLWTQMKHKKNHLIKTITPAYSRKSENPGYNSFSVEINDSKDRSRQVDRIVNAETDIMKLRERVASEAASSKKKDIEIESLKKHIAELTNDKKQVVIKITQLLLELHNLSTSYFPAKGESMAEQENDKNNLNQSSIRRDSVIKDLKPRKIFVDEDGISGDTGRLLELLRSTEQYREFVFYYDNNELSFLRTLNKMKRRNCQCDQSQKEKTLWAPRNVIDMLGELNIKNNLGLKKDEIQKIVYNINLLYLQHEKSKISQLKTEHDKKIKELQREVNHAIPYEIMQIQKHKERELTAKRGRRVNSVATK